MRSKDVIWLGVKGISERKVRTALTILTVVIGIAAIVALVSLVSGISASVSASLQSIGPTTLYLSPGRSSIFTAADVAEIEGFPNVSTVIPIIRSSANLTVSGTQTTATIIGVDNSSLAKAIGSVNLYSGAVYNDTTLPFVVVGHNIAFPTTSQVLPSISLDQPIYLTVTVNGGTKTLTAVPVGIFNTYGSSSFISPDTSIFMSLQAAESLTNKYSYSALLVQATNTSTVGSLDTLLTNVFGSSISIISVQQIAATVSSITGSIALLLGSVAGVSLLVAGISILSIMMVSVTERTKEIGILKAIGFKKRDVLMLFLTEAVIIGFAGGVVGTIVGGGAAYLLPTLLSSHSSTPATGGTAAVSTTPATFGGGGAARAGGGGAGFAGGTDGGFSGGSSSSAASSISLTPIVSISTIVIAIAIALIVSVLASLYPAFKAASVDPIVALRSE